CTLLTALAVFGAVSCKSTPSAKGQERAPAPQELVKVPAPPFVAPPQVPPQPVKPPVALVKPPVIEGLILTGAKTHMVVYGDTLSSLAKRYYGEQNGYYYGAIMLASDFVADPDLIFPDEVLTIPALEQNLENPSTRRQIKRCLAEVAAIHTRKGDIRAAEGVQALTDSL
ncbi:LysM peptidoglycan-binding domain-containing protein, partial [Treponema endosymbiont of Eucomonympha sp.]|uniref:LysM peptidoglycan-binding domain-containing protein n=1 Tax=Treponema endosymbiont of Eucomonympha sp. TaxID=1580831 RepID=UPI000A706B6F